MLFLLAQIIKGYENGGTEMVINDRKNFISIITKLLEGLEYENISKLDGEKSLIDITAEKDGEKYCFKCRY